MNQTLCMLAGHKETQPLSVPLTLIVYVICSFITRSVSYRKTPGSPVHSILHETVEFIYQHLFFLVQALHTHARAHPNTYTHCAQSLSGFRHNVAVVFYSPADGLQSTL